MLKIIYYFSPSNNNFQIYFSVKIYLKEPLDTLIFKFIKSTFFFFFTFILLYMYIIKILCLICIIDELDTVKMNKCVLVDECI